MNKIKANLTSELLYLFNSGKLYHAYRTWGAHIVDDGVQFTVWAPDVRAVYVCGDFNAWKGTALQHIGEGTWSGYVPNAAEGDRYKYRIVTRDGRELMKADPYGFACELRPDTASVIADISYKWNDGRWMKQHGRTDKYADSDKLFKGPMNIYEVHTGSWRRHPVEDGFYSYEELADTLIPYVCEMGYTHIELLPIMEHPLDASWGYQVTGYYAATARHGKPAELMSFIDRCHRAGIGVILDWVPGHFCPDAHGLAEFNGSMLYESEIHPDWGTYKFDFSRGQVRSFLLSNAMFWLTEFHADGLRVDGVSSMLYLNFGISDPRKRKFNKYGEEGNLEAIEFLQDLNRMIGERVPGAFTCAEESSAWPMVTMPPDMGGLGFHFKWNMGWMNDTLSYMQTDFPYRRDIHNKLTFAMSYAYSENYILPLSHDEVVHGKCSLIGRMPGMNVEAKFAGARLLAMYQMTHPGKKLNFMGNEFSQFIEWREYEELEWFLLEYDNHRKFKDYIADLNRIYLKEPALWSEDFDFRGFRWIDADNRDQQIYSYMRFAHKTEEGRADSDSGADDSCDILLTVVNAGTYSYDKYRIGVPCAGSYKELINSDNDKYAGSGIINKRAIRAKAVPMHGMPYSIEIKLPADSGCIFKLKPIGKKK